ncbi:MAG: aldo/keto reductase [Deltaproteobacteria bacterium]|nr:aldo/keto reductase [Deltaproteobacteria bacterium]
MLYRPFGSTGIDVSAIGFGGMRFEFIDDEEACASLVKSAHERGINYFDTAPAYFEGRSEERFGLAFSEMKKTRAERPFYVSSKTTAAEPDQVRRDLERSLERMGLDALDFYYVWWVAHPKSYFDRKARGALEAFTRLKEEGLIKHVVLSSHMSGVESEEVLADYPFEGVLIGYSAMNFTYRQRTLEAAARGGRGVVVMNPLGGGIIPQHVERFDFLRTRDDESVVEASLRFLLATPEIQVVLVGLGNQQHLEEAISAVDGFEGVSEAQMARIRERLVTSFDQMCTGCGYCDTCPEDLPIPRLMQSFNERLFSDEPKKVINALRFAHGIYPEGHHVDQCTECGQCEEVCTQSLPIIGRLKLIQHEIEQHG